MVTENGITVDLTKITKRQMLDWRRGRREIIENNDDPESLERYDFETLFQKVIVSWPFGEVDFETFLDLPYPESVSVDNVVSEAITALSEKK